MRRSNVSPLRVRTGTILVLAVAASLVVAGCGGTGMTGSGEPAPSATETVNREAGWWQERIRVCFKNGTTRNIDYSFAPESVDDEREYLSSRSGTMGPNAFVCGASRNEGFLSDSVTFGYTSSAGETYYVFIDNDKGKFTLTLNEIEKGGKPRSFMTIDAKAGIPAADRAGSEAIDVLVGTSVRTFNKIKAIPIDVRISDAR